MTIPLIDIVVVRERRHRRRRRRRSADGRPPDIPLPCGAAGAAEPPHRDTWREEGTLGAKKTVANPEGQPRCNATGDGAAGHVADVAAGGGVQYF